MFTESFADIIKKQLSNGEISEDQLQQFTKCMWELSAVDLALMSAFAPDSFDKFLRDTVHQSFPHSKIETV